MDYTVWIYILLAVVILLILSLYFLIKKPSNKIQEELVNKEKQDYRYPKFTGVNLRENFRVELEDVHCFIEFLDVDNEELDPKFFHGVMKNISLGGLKVVGEHEYPIEDDIQIKVRFSLKDSMFIVRGKLVRKELYPEKDRFGYGVQFTSLLDEDRELLYQILNRIMIEKRRKRIVGGLVTDESMV